MLVIAPAILFVAFFATKVLSMNYFAHNASTSFIEEEYTTSQQNGDRQKLLNFFEPWIAYYNSGTSLLALGAYQEATADLGMSLSLTDDPMIQCDIRANLAIALERAGDEYAIDDNFDLAQSSFDKSREVLDAADESCLDDQSDPDSSESIEGTQERLDNKGVIDITMPEEEEPDNAAQEQLQEQIDQNAENRQQEEDVQRAEGGAPLPDSQPVDKPW